MSTDTHQNGPEPTFTPAEDAAEQAAWAALQREDEGTGETGGIGSSEGASGEGSPEETGAGSQSGEQGTDQASGDQSGGTGEQEPVEEPKPEDPKPDLAASYQAAMREERQKRQAMEAELSQIKQAIADAKAQRDQPAEPSIDEDPVAYFEHQQRQLQAQLEETRQAQHEDQQAREEQQRQHQFITQVQQDEQAFAAKTPDYFDATEHLRNTRLSQLATIYPDGPQGDAYANQMGYQTAAQLRNAHLEQEVSMYANSAYQTGQSPAEVFYNLAKSAGWAAKPAAPPPQERVQAARAGVERAQSLSGGGGSGQGANNATVAELADLFMTDPEAADKLFDQLAERGELG